MLIGFALLITSVTTESLPVSRRIYTDQAACDHIKKYILV